LKEEEEEEEEEIALEIHEQPLEQEGYMNKRTGVIERESTLGAISFFWICQSVLFILFYFF
jgi:hypothetical protein